VEEPPVEIRTDSHRRFVLIGTGHFLEYDDLGAVGLDEIVVIGVLIPNDQVGILVIGKILHIGTDDPVAECGGGAVDHDVVAADSYSYKLSGLDREPVSQDRGPLGKRSAKIIGRIGDWFFQYSGVRKNYRKLEEKQGRIKRAIWADGVTKEGWRGICNQLKGKRTAGEGVYLRRRLRVGWEGVGSAVKERTPPLVP
jgi:hypothetical protein